MSKLAQPLRRGKTLVPANSCEIVRDQVSSLACYWWIGLIGEIWPSGRKQTLDKDIHVNVLLTITGSDR